MKMLVTLLLLLGGVSQHASGVEVEVEVEEGAESVLLPCQVPADVSRNSTAVWDRDEFKVPTVHVRDPSGDDLIDQNHLYTGRTSMRADALQTGDLSLTLRNPTDSDSGTYTCTTRRLGRDLSQTDVQLKVTEPPPAWPKVLLAVLVPLVLLAAASGVFVFSASQRMKSSEECKVEVVKVSQGQTSVLLPFKPTAEVPQDVRVEWKHKDMKVHVYERGNNQPDQHQDYRGRTEMDEDPLRTGDLSLTLKHLQPSDSGVYTCTVCNKDGDILLQKVVALSVRVPQPEFVEVTQEKSVLLPFKPTAELSQDVTVEWRYHNILIHVYERGNNQPDQHQDYRGHTEMDEDPLRAKDLSLTLKHLQLCNSGVYICRVYNKDGDILLQKVVTLRVTAPEPEVVEVTQGDTVLLPFKPTTELPQDITVEWRYHNILIHVYEEGNNQPDQHQDYRGRTEMDEDPLRAKDFSLRLKPPYLTDNGVYICTVYKKGRVILLQKSVTLFVRDPESEFVEELLGVESVLLPFKPTAELPQDVRVEWKHKDMKVHVYERGNNQPDQHEDYRGRTEMDEDPLRAKDLSLTLKHLYLSDDGVYTCTVYNKDGYVLLHKVKLSFSALQPEVVEVTQGQESVLLPCKATAELPQDVTVEWRHKHMKVHVYERGNNQPDQHQDYRGRTEMDEDPLRAKDLSLTLKHLQPSDSGVYTCRIYKNEEILLHKVILRVRAPKPEVEVSQGQQSVLLPCKATAELPQDVTVEWRHKHMKVHVYERGNNQPDQHQDYRGRTEMDEDPLRAKDLSLTLKHLQLSDSGVYICRVYNKDGRRLLKKSVTLFVNDCQVEFVEVSQDQQSVQLPFKPTAELPQDVTVEWKHNDMKVHVYERGNNPPDQHQDYRGHTEMDEDPLRAKDLSLTLKHLQPSDSGVYTCTVYNKNADRLLQKSVALSVRATLGGTMAEMLTGLKGLRWRRAPRAETNEELRNGKPEHVPLMEVKAD